MKLIKDKLLFEDLFTSSETKGPSFPDSRSTSEQMSLLDILSKAQGDTQHPNFAPHEMLKLNGTEFITEFLGEIYIAISRLEAAIKSAKNNPAIKDRQAALDQLVTILKKLLRIKRILRSIKTDISNFSIDKPNK